MLASGEELPADYLVLATGSSYPFPAKSDVDRTADAHEKTLGTHAALAAAARVLLVGAGAVGIELAGEIKAVWPSKQVTLVDVAGDVLGGPFRADLKAELRRQLAALGVQVLLGSPLRARRPPSRASCGPSVATGAGTEATADIWFRCYGFSRSATTWPAGSRQPAGRTGTSRSRRRCRSRARTGCSRSGTCPPPTARWRARRAARPRSWPRTSGR